MNANIILTLGLLITSLTNTTAKPNIIYILADDLGYGDLGCYGQKVIQTPRIDAMAGEGLKFTQHYAGSTICGPSRSSLLEGKHTGHTYVRGNGTLQMRENPNELIFPQALQQVGYHTAMIGKSGIGCNTDDATLPEKKGFDYFFGFTSHTAAHFYFPPYLWKNQTKQLYPNNTLHEGDTYSSEVIINEALQYIERQKEGPFFLHLALQIPHASLRAKEEWKAKYRPILQEKPAIYDQHYHYSVEPEPKTTFAAMVSYMDHNVGLILDQLEELGLTENTLILFASDNGPMTEGGHSAESFNSNGPLRGGKRDLFEGGIRVPMIARWPGTITAGTTTDHISAFWDISPTIREIANAQPQADTDGISLVPTLLAKGHQNTHPYLYWEFHEKKGLIAIRKDEWKMIRFETSLNVQPKVELYNLKDDLEEQNDLSAKHPEIVTELSQLMDQAHTLSEHPKFRLASELDEEEFLRLNRANNRKKKL